MLINVRSPKIFQRYLDKQEQRLFVQMAPLLQAAVNMQVTTNGVKAEDYIVERGQPMLLRHYERIYIDQYRAVSDQLDETKAATDESTETDFMRAQHRSLESRAGKQIRSIAGSQRDAVAAKVLALTQEGSSNQEITREIRKLAPQLSKARAATIARTETHISANTAISETIKDKRVPMQKKIWHSAQDGRVRETHEDANGQERPFDDPFDVGNSQLMYPGDDSLGADEGEIINCRCAVLYEAGEEEDVDLDEKPEVEEEPEPPEEQELYRDPFKSEEERSWATPAFANAPVHITQAMERTPPVISVGRSTNATSYWWKDEIMMKEPKGTQRGNAVYMHEFGHHLDSHMRKDVGTELFWSQSMLKEATADQKRVATVMRKGAKLKPTDIDDKVNVVYDKYYDAQARTMAKPNAMRITLNELFAEEGAWTKGKFTGDDFMAFTHQGGVNNAMETIRAAVELKEGLFKTVYTKRTTKVPGAFGRMGWLKKEGGDAVDGERKMIGQLADYLGALTKNKAGYGHAKKYYNEVAYWDKPGLLQNNQGTEMVAQYYALEGAGNNPTAQAARKILQTLAPDTWRAIDEQVRSWAKRKKT